MAEKSNSDSEKNMRLGDTSTSEKLPPELIVEILSRLPTPYLWPLRCVSKPWFRLITRDSQFAKLNFDRSVQYKSNPSCIVAWGEKSIKEQENFDFYLATDHTECDKAIKLNVPFLSDEHNPRNYPVYSICNGMLCLCDDDKHEVYIWNPLTNDHIAIPYPVTPLRSTDNQQATVFGFGFLRSVNEYKVIRLVSECNCGELEYHTQLSVYTLGKDSSWRIVKDDIPFDINLECVPCPQINEKGHWLARRDGEFPVHTLLIFDLKDESLQEVYRPPINDRSDMTSIQELGGVLCLFNAYNSKGVDMWRMKVDGEEYSMLTPLTLGRPEVTGGFDVLIPLGVVAHSGDIIVLKTSKGLITYNPSTKSINHLKEFVFPVVNAHTFFGSIISPKAINGTGNLGTKTGPLREN